MEYVQCGDASGAKSGASKKLSEVFRVAETKGKPILFLASGGSALKALDESVYLPKNFAIGLVDERQNVSLGDRNAYLLSLTPFFKKASAKKTAILFDVPSSLCATGEYFDNYEDTLKNWRSNHPDCFVVVLLGMGADGHTAGIFPMPDDSASFNALYSNERYFVVHSYGAGRLKERITVSISFLKREVDAAVVFCTGQDKISALKKVVSGAVLPHERPGAVWKDMKQAYIYSDIRL